MFILPGLTYVSALIQFWGLLFCWVFEQLCTMHSSTQPDLSAVGTTYRQQNIRQYIQGRRHDTLKPSIYFECIE